MPGLKVESFFKRNPDFTNSKGNDGSAPNTCRARFETAFGVDPQENSKVFGKLSEDNDYRCYTLNQM